MIQQKLSVTINHEMEYTTYNIEDDKYGEMSWSEHECRICHLQEWLIKKFDYPCKKQI